MYAYSSEKSRKVEFHLRVLVKALLEELEKLKFDVSVPLLVGGYEYDFESAGHEVETSFGIPNVWDWVIRAIVAALLALLTPCVFPMIPVTVSYFTKQTEGGGGGLFLPVVYALVLHAVWTHRMP